MNADKPQDINNSDPNTNNSNNTNTQRQPDYRDWREQRRAWRDERRARRGPLGGLFWGLMLIMLGLVFFAHQQAWISDDNWWQYLLVGLGTVFIIDGLVRYWSADYRRESLGRFIPGIILIGVGIAFIFNFSQWWPVVLIAVGVVILLSFLFRRGLIKDSGSG